MKTLQQYVDEDRGPGPGHANMKWMYDRWIFWTLNTSWVRNALFVRGVRWWLCYPVTPPAYAHRLERQLDPVPDGMFSGPVDRRVR